MAAINLGVSVRDYLIVVGYFEKWLVAIDEKSNYFVAEENLHLYEIGTVCDADMIFIPAEQLSKEMYRAFKEEFMEGK